MNGVTRILSQIESGDPSAAQQLLPLVYDELRKLAAARLAQEKPGQTLQPTALVHEAYLRLSDGAASRHWNSRGHFFAAAAEAMRRILVEAARRKQTAKHGGDFDRQPTALAEIPVACQRDPLEVVTVSESLESLALRSPRAADLVKLRYFLGCTLAEAATMLGVSESTAEEEWTYARAWLRRDWLRGEKTSLI